MTELNQIYKCNICGNVVEMVRTGAGQLVCCGGIRVRVGSAVHPMEIKHFIEWIEITADGQVLRKHLNPGDEPAAEFLVQAVEITARAYCNLHGLWKSTS